MADIESAERRGWPANTDCRIPARARCAGMIDNRPRRRLAIPAKHVPNYTPEALAAVDRLLAHPAPHTELSLTVGECLRSTRSGHPSPGGECLLLGVPANGCRR